VEELELEQAQLVGSEVEELCTNIFCNMMLNAVELIRG
jgi:hypothetical protein